jgi:hypothetical protein
MRGEVTRSRRHTCDPPRRQQRVRELTHAQRDVDALPNQVNDPIVEHAWRLGLRSPTIIASLVRSRRPLRQGHEL